MIIKIIPEPNEPIQPVEHHNVKEFFIFGNKKDEDGILIDFHDWSGQYRYLLGSLSYFTELVKLEMSSKHRAPEMAPFPQIQLPPQEADAKTGIVKQVPIAGPNLKIIKTADMQELNEEEMDEARQPSEGAEDEVEEAPVEAVIDVDKKKK